MTKIIYRSPTTIWSFRIIALILDLIVLTACVSPPFTTSTPVTSGSSTPIDTSIPFTTTPSLEPQDQKPFDLVNQIGGVSKALAVKDTYAYIGVGPRLMVIDASELSAPQILGQSEILSGVIQRIVLTNNYALVVTEVNLSIIDISNPRVPQLASTLDLNTTNDVVVANGYAYVAIGEPCVINSAERKCEGGLWVVDISEPTHPKELGFVSTPGEARSVFVVGDYAYLAEGDRSHNAGGLRVVDVSNPQTPQLIGFLNTKNASSVVVVGHYAYVAGDGFWILDVSTPNSPIEVASLDTSENYVDLVVTGNYAYLVKSFGELGTCSNSLWLVDIHDPASPQHVSSIPKGILLGEVNTGKAIQVVNGLVYLVTDSGFEILDVFTENRIVIGRLNTIGAVQEVSILNDHLYLIAGGTCGGILKVIDIQDSLNLKPLTDCIECGGANKMVIKDPYIYFGTWGEGLKIFGTEDPNHPNLLSQLILGEEGARGIYNLVFVQEDYIAITMENYILRIVDIKNPAQPNEIAFLTLNGLGDVQVATSGNYMYVPLLNCKESECVSTLQVIDLEDPSKPRLVNKVKLIGGAQAVAIVGNYAYISSSPCYSDNSDVSCSEMLWVLDISEPTQPIEVAALNLSEGGNKIFATDNYIYLLGDSSLAVIDITDPILPHEVGSSLFPERTLDMVVVDKNIYLANQDGGLLILQATSDKIP